jgi:hypothetical protein
MITKRRAAARIMAMLKLAYAELDAIPLYEYDDRASQALGRYDGLKLAYIALTGRDDQDVAHEVVDWYVGTPEYQLAKRHYYKYGQGSVL